MRLKRSISITLTIVLLSGILGFLPASAKNYTVNDIQSTDNDVVQWVVNQGYMSLTLGKFLPAKYVKRNEFAAIVTKLMGSGTKLQNPKKPTFQDVTTKDQFYKQIETAKSYITSFKAKTSKVFKPNSYLTREDAMYSIVKVLGYDTDEAMGSNDNTDLSIDDIIEDAGRIAPALMKYVSVGISNELMDLRTVEDKIYFDPKKNISRIDLAYLIYNAYQRKDYSIEEGVDEFKDEPESTSVPSSTPTPAQTPTPSDASKQIDVSAILSDSSAVSKMLNIKDGETINLSDIHPSMRGTVTKTSSSPDFHNDSYAQNDVILLGNIISNKSLAYGEESLISFEYVYNVKSCEKGVIQVGFNDSDYANDTNRFLWAVPKGSGILVFKIPVTPKKWAETPFRVSAGIIDLSNFKSLPVGYRVNLLPSDQGRVSVF